MFNDGQETDRHALDTTITPPLPGLAGEDDDPSESHIVRGID
ncbi:hypothetical protein [Streptomyces sp. ISL-96]|nr:hypothetical protein [Streptomyces sp. ISL-96]